YAQRQRPAAG
ncbi:transposase, partial [Mycobacterium tuberculosis SK-B]